MEDLKGTSCPTCSETLTFPINLFDKNNKRLLDFLIRIVDCKVEATNGTFNICFKCLNLLITCLNFKFNCEKSLEKFKNVQKEEQLVEKEIIVIVKEDYSDCDDSDDVSENIDDASLNVPTEHKSILQSLLGDDIKSKNQDPTTESNLKDAVENDDLLKRTIPRRNPPRLIKEPPKKRTINVQKLLTKHIAKKPVVDNSNRRLVRYPPELCIKAYKDSIKSFYATRQCPFCLISMQNRHRLGTHVATVHADIRSKWCLRCNTIEENITEHNNTLHKDQGLFVCKLCKRNLHSAPEMRCHLDRHSVSRIKHKLKAEWLICEHCPEIFATLTELDEHQCSNAPLQITNIENGEEQQDLLNIFDSATIDAVEDNCDVPKITRKGYDKYPYEAVDRALRETMKDFYTNRQCPICGLLTRNLNVLKLHVLGDNHKDVNEKWCSKCNKLVDNLAEHSEEHPVDYYTCPFCHKDWEDRYKLKMHLTHHCALPFVTVKTDWFICKKCPKSYPYKNELKQHLMNECEGGGTSDELDNEASTDDMDDTNKTVIDQTKRIKATGPIIKSCPMCKAQVKYLSMHIKKVHMDPLKEKTSQEESESVTSEAQDVESQSQDSEQRDNVASRDTCQMRRRNKMKFMSSKNKIANRKKMGRPPRKGKPECFLCNYCGYKAKSITRLNTHLKTHTGEKPFECSVCNKRFNNTASKRDHELRHLDVKRFPCDICGKLYMTKSETRMHRAMHETKLQECYICKKQFCRPQLLKMHMRQHTDADKFPCNQCDAKFYLNRLLTRHIIYAHTKERPYKCNYCSKDFKFVERLTAHERVHKGIKPYGCSCCSYITTTSYSLTVHMKQHPEDSPQPDNPHKCVLCYKSYSTKAMLISHTKNVHMMTTMSQEKLADQDDENQLLDDYE